LWVSLLLFRAGLLVQPLYERGKDIASLVLRRNKLGRYDILFTSSLGAIMPFNKIIRSWIDPSVGAQLIAPRGPRPSRAQSIAPLRKAHSDIILLKRIIASLRHPIPFVDEPIMLVRGGATRSCHCECVPRRLVGRRRLDYWLHFRHTGGSLSCATGSGRRHFRLAPRRGGQRDASR